jgi:hypothetical protein
MTYWIEKCKTVTGVIWIKTQETYCGQKQTFGPKFAKTPRSKACTVATWKAQHSRLNVWADNSLISILKIKNIPTIISKFANLRRLKV